MTVDWRAYPIDDPRLDAVIERLRLAETTLAADARTLGLPSGAYLGLILRRHIGKDAYRALRRERKAVARERRKERRRALRERKRHRRLARNALASKRLLDLQEDKRLRVRRARVEERYRILEPVIARLRARTSTLTAESQRLGFKNSNWLRTALRACLGPKEYEAMMHPPRPPKPMPAPRPSGQSRKLKSCVVCDRPRRYTKSWFGDHHGGDPAGPPPRMCRWCGDPAVDGPWCEEHALMAANGGAPPCPQCGAGLHAETDGVGRALERCSSCAHRRLIPRVADPSPEAPGHSWRDEVETCDIFDPRHVQRRPKARRGPRFRFVGRA
jgi:hypothetical protein